MRRTIAHVCRSLGLLSFDFLARERSTHPDPASVGAGDLVVVRDGEHLKWACMRCPGGCGADIKLSLNPLRRPRWTVVRDWLGRPSVSPSVHRRDGCGCHFWIRRGRVEWCRGGRPEEQTKARTVSDFAEQNRRS